MRALSVASCGRILMEFMDRTDKRRGWYRTVIGGILVLAGMFPAAPTARAQETASFTRLGFGARGIAMGNALVADGFGEGSPYYNPALAPFTRTQNLELSAALLRFDRQLQFLQFAAPFKPRAGFATGLIHAAVTNIDGRDGSGFHTRNLSTDELAFFLAFGLKVGERASIGVGLQLFRSDLLDEIEPVKSVGIDLGLMIQPSDALRLGFVADDLLARYLYDTSGALGDNGRSNTDNFPIRLRAGGAYQRPGSPLLLTAEFEVRVSRREQRIQSVSLAGGFPREVTDEQKLNIAASRLRIGAEYMLAEAFALRGGLDRIGTGGADGTKPTAGFMIEQAVGELRIRADYAFALEPFAVGTMHIFTLRLYL